MAANPERDPNGDTKEDEYAAGGGTAAFLHGPRLADRGPQFQPNIAGRDIVDEALTLSVGRTGKAMPLRVVFMDTPFILGRKAVDDATSLMADFGQAAVEEAASRAAQSRASMNISRYCHWRQVERLVATLNDHGAVGTIH